MISNNTSLPNSRSVSQENEPNICSTKTSKVGKTIQCEGCFKSFNSTHSKNQNAHVQRCNSCLAKIKTSLKKLFNYFAEKYDTKLHQKFIFAYQLEDFFLALNSTFDEEEYAQDYFANRLFEFADKIAKYVSGGQLETQESILKIFGEDFVKKTYGDKNLSESIAEKFKLSLNQRLPFKNSDDFWNASRKHFDTLNAYDDILANEYRAFVKTQIKACTLESLKPESAANFLLVSFLANEISSKAKALHSQHPEIYQSNLEDYAQLYIKIPGLESKLIKKVIMRTFENNSGIAGAKKFYDTFILGKAEDESLHKTSEASDGSSTFPPSSHALVDAYQLPVLPSQPALSAVAPTA